MRGLYPLNSNLNTWSCVISVSYAPHHLPEYCLPQGPSSQFLCSLPWGVWLAGPAAHSGHVARPWGALNKFWLRFPGAWLSGAARNVGHGDPKSLGSWCSPGAQLLDAQGFQGEVVGTLGSMGLMEGLGKGDCSRYYLSWPWGARLWGAGRLGIQLMGDALVIQ